MRRIHSSTLESSRPLPKSPIWLESKSLMCWRHSLRKVLRLTFSANVYDEIRKRRQNRICSHVGGLGAGQARVGCERMRRRRRNVGVHCYEAGRRLAGGWRGLILTPTFTWKLKYSSIARPQPWSRRCFERMQVRKVSTQITWPLLSIASSHLPSVDILMHRSERAHCCAILTSLPL